MADTSSSVHARLAREIKRHRPAAIVATNGAGEEIHIALTGSRMRWERAATALIKVGAVKANLCNADGSVLDVLDVVEPEREPAAPPAAKGAPSVTSSEVERIVKIAMDAVDRSRQRDIESMREVTQAAVEVMRAAGERADRLDKLLTNAAIEREEAIERAHTQLARIVNTKGDKEPATDPAADMMMQFVMARMFGMPMGMPMPGAAPPAPPAAPPTNGKGGKGH